VPTRLGDAIAIPEGYPAQVLTALGAPIDLATRDCVPLTNNGRRATTGPAVDAANRARTRTCAARRPGRATPTSFSGKPASVDTLKRFLVGVPGAEIAGVDLTPDNETPFVGVQHPGETAARRSCGANGPRRPSPTRR
jgi:hypothetical protein